MGENSKPITDRKDEGFIAFRMQQEIELYGLV